MSETWKGWMRSMDKWGPDDDDRIGVNRPVKDRREANYTAPVIVTPIEDESLPHPGDGRIWEYDGDPIAILGPPVPRLNGSPIVPFEVLRNGDVYMKAPFALSERKPEPRHKPWCRWDRESYKPSYVACTCERRCGEDRRQGERRAKWRDWMTDQGGRRGSVKARRRSGTDRRSS